MQNFSSFRLELTELQPLEALWIRPKVFPLVYWKLAKLCLGNIEETHTEPGKKIEPIRSSEPREIQL